MGQAEAPGAVVVRGPIGHHVRLVRERVQSLSEHLERHSRAHRLAVGNDVQARMPKVNDAHPIGRGDVCVADVPLIGHRPVEHLCPARDLRPLEWHMLLEDIERRPHAASGQAPAEPEQPLHQLVRLGSDRVKLHQSTVPPRQRLSFGRQSSPRPDRGRGRATRNRSALQLSFTYLCILDSRTRIREQHPRGCGRQAPPLTAR